MKVKINISKKLIPLLKSVREVGRVVSKEATRIGQTVRDIESGKLKITATVEVTNEAKPSRRAPRKE